VQKWNPAPKISTLIVANIRRNIKNFRPTMAIKALRVYLHWVFLAEESMANIKLSIGNVSIW